MARHGQPFVARIFTPQEIAYCERLYESSALPVLFRITPFSQPGDLEAELEHRGYERFDATSVEAMTIDPSRLNGASAQPMDQPSASRSPRIRARTSRSSSPSCVIRKRVCHWRNPTLQWLA